MNLDPWPTEAPALTPDQKKAAIREKARAKLVGKDLRWRPRSRSLLPAAIISMGLFLCFPLLWIVIAFVCAEPKGVDHQYLQLFAIDEACDAVRQRLKAPKTAEFPSTWSGAYDVRVVNTDLYSGAYHISSYVDAQNGFGALIRSRWVVDLTLIDTSGKVQLQGVWID